MQQIDTEPARFCGHKRQFATRAKAREGKKRLRMKTGERFGIYRCEACGFFHVAHRDMKSRRKA